MDDRDLASTREAFEHRLSELGIQGHWAANAKEPENEPVPRPPFLWKWKDIDPLLFEAAKLYGMTGGASRRTLRLCPPGVIKSTTPTIHTSVQCVMPGETAPVHRHSMGAFRFVISEGGGETIVGGQAFPMNRFDLITTPAWSWHEHRNRSDKPAVWIDGHDLPIVRHANSVFFEADQGGREKANQSTNARGHRFSGAEHLAKLAAGEGTYSECEGQLITYMAEPACDLFPTIECSLHALSDKASARGHRHTWSQIYYVVSGRGVLRTPVGELLWGEGDFFLAPAWIPHRLIAGEDTVLFCATDRPLLMAIQQDREVPCDL